MKTQTKNEVIELLATKHDNVKTKYKALVAKLISLDVATPSQKRYFNASGYSKVNLDTLEYDLKKMCGIKDSELNREKRAVKKPKEDILTGEQRLLAIDFEDEDVDLIQEAKDLVEFSELDKLMPEPIPEFSTGINGTKERAEYIDKFELKSPSRKKDDQVKVITERYNADMDQAILAAIENLKNAQAELIQKKSDEHTAAVKEIFVNASEEVKVDLKLRDEFPFLNSEDCPDKLKILVADKLTAYNKFRDSRAEVKQLIENGASNEDVFEVAKTAVENFELNLEIYDELNYYKEHGEILGEHSIFAEDMLNEAVEKMSTVELTKRQKNLRSYISRDTKKIAKMEAGENKDKAQEKVDEWQKELDLIDARLAKIS